VETLIELVKIAFVAYVASAELSERLLHVFEVPFASSWGRLTTSVIGVLVCLHVVLSRASNDVAVGGGGGAPLARATRRAPKYGKIARIWSVIVGVLIGLSLVLTVVAIVRSREPIVADEVGRLTCRGADGELSRNGQETILDSSAIQRRSRFRWACRENIEIYGCLSSRDKDTSSSV